MYLTNHRVVFQPRPYSGFFDGQRCWFLLSEIDDVRLLPRDRSQLLGGSFRDRVLVEMDNGVENLFAVRHPDELIARIRTAVKENWL